MKKEKLVEVKNLKTYFQVGGQTAKAVDGLDFEIYKGEVLGIVGESGSGKSVTSLSLIQLIPNPPGEVADGEIIFKGNKIYDGEELQKIKQTPKYHFFNQLDSRQRNIGAFLFIVVWFILYSLLPIPGALPFLIATIVGFSAMLYLFYDSPRKKALQDFREKVFQKIRNIRGKEIAMIFQEPMTSLNPVFTVGMQVIEALYPKSLFEYLQDWVIGTAKNIKTSSLIGKLKACGITATLILFFSQLILGWSFELMAMVMAVIAGGVLPVMLWLIILGLDLLIPNGYRQKYETLFKEGVKLLEAVGIPDSAERMNDYPHQFSGGMRQRAMIAMALAQNPSLLIADEPTTALDVTIQAQILELMMEVKNRREDSAIVLITHDLAVVAETCERVIVMYGGKIQEVAEVMELFDHPQHPYTAGLLHSIPRPEQQKRERLEAIRGMVPNILNFPPGCKFCSRCDEKMDICETVEPELIELSPGHWVRCHLYIAKE